MIVLRKQFDVGIHSFADFCRVKHRQRLDAPESNANSQLKLAIFLIPAVRRVFDVGIHSFADFVA